MEAKISVMIDTELWTLIREKICIPKTSVTEDSEKIDMLVNHIIWDYLKNPHH